MFPSSLLVLLVTLVLFNRAAKIENKNYFNNITNFEDTTYPTSKFALFRPNGIENIAKGNYENKSTSETNNNSVLKQFTSGITGYINAHFNSSCETSGIIIADDEVCLCKNSTVLFFFKKNNCVLVKVTNISKKNTVK